jgi:hypothetical protein
MDYRHDAFAIFDKPDILRYKRFKSLRITIIVPVSSRESRPRTERNVFMPAAICNLREERSGFFSSRLKTLSMMAFQQVRIERL